MNQNNISHVPEITFPSKQIVSREIGLGIPVSEASYIAAPNSIKIVEEEGEISGTVQKYYWTPLSSYLFEIKQSYITTFTKINNNTSTSSDVNVIKSLKGPENNTISYDTVTIPLTDIYDQINTIKNSTIGTLPPTSADQEISISDKVGINVISNVGINGNSISYTYTPIKVDFTEINATIQSIIEYLDPQISLSATPAQIVFTGENYKNGVNTFVTTNVINTSLIKWESTDKENVKLNTYVGLNNIITPISYKNTSPDDKISISIKTTSLIENKPKEATIDIPIKYNKTNGGLINISYKLYNEYGGL